MENKKNDFEEPFAARQTSLFIRVTRGVHWFAKQSADTVIRFNSLPQAPWIQLGAGVACAASAKLVPESASSLLWLIRSYGTLVGFLLVGMGVLNYLARDDDQNPQRK